MRSIIFIYNFNSSKQMSRVKSQCKVVPAILSVENNKRDKTSEQYRNAFINSQFQVESPLKTPKTLIIFKFSKFSLFLYFCSNKRTGTSGNFTRPGRTVPFFPSLFCHLASFALFCFLHFRFFNVYFLLLLGEAVHRRAPLILNTQSTITSM